MADPVDTTATPSSLDDPRLSELEQQVLAKFTGGDEPQGYAALVDNAQEPIPADGEPAVDDPAPAPAPTPTHPGDPDAVPDVPPVPSPETAPVVPPADPATAPDPSGVDASTDPTLQTWDAWDDDTKSQAVRVAEWATGLSEESQLQIDAVLSGQYALVPVEDIPKITAFYQAEQAPSVPAAPTPAPSGSPDYNPYALDEPIDPQVAALQAQVSQLTASQQQAQEQAQLAYQRDAINSGSDQWFAQHSDLTAAERERLSTYVARSGIYQGFAQSMSPDRAVQQALNSALAQDSQILSRRTEAEVAQRLQQEREAAIAQQERARAQSALSGSGASVPGVASIQDPDQAMVAMVEAAMRGDA